jgi:signal transduction histidine kinase
MVDGADHSLSLPRGDLGVRLNHLVEESWVRSRSYGIDPHHLRRQRRNLATLVPRQERARLLLEAAEPVVRLVHSVLRHEAHMVGVSDADGFVVRLASSHAEEEAINFFEGASWNERDIGTNGIGTALAARAPVLVAGSQHFVHDYSHWTCIGVPLRAPDGTVLGALDLSVRNDRMSEHTWGWALSLVGSIEAHLARAAEDRAPGDDEIDTGGDPRLLRTAVHRLVQDRRRLEDWDRRKDGAFATLSHELKSPLQAMALSLEMMARAHGNTGRLDELTARLRHQVRKLGRVVGDIGDVARVKSGGLAVQKQALDLNAVVARAVEAVQPQMNERRHRVQLRLAPQPLIVEGDAVRLEQVFTNILGNSAKYTPPGGNVAVESEIAGSDARVVVRDDGCGVAPEDLGRIFVEFTRVVDARNDPGGLGIGLALVRSIVRLHGGSVIARSDGPGRGTELDVALPLAPGRFEIGA